MIDDFLTIDDVSKKLELSKSCLYNYVSKSKIPYLKLGGKLLFTEMDLNTWIESKKVKAVNP